MRRFAPLMMAAFVALLSIFGPAQTVVKAAASDILARAALPGTFDFCARFSIVAKDVAIGIAEGRALGVPLSVIETVGQAWASEANVRVDQAFARPPRWGSSSLPVLRASR